MFAINTLIPNPAVAQPCLGFQSTSKTKLSVHWLCWEISHDHFNHDRYVSDNFCWLWKYRLEQGPGTAVLRSPKLLSLKNCTSIKENVTRPRICRRLVGKAFLSLTQHNVDTTKGSQSSASSNTTFQRTHTWQMAADMIDLLSILPSASRAVSVRFVDQDLDTTTATTALFSTLLLHTTTQQSASLCWASASGLSTWPPTAPAAYING